MKLKQLPIRFNLPGGVQVRRNRRRMAWLSLLSMIGIVLLMMFFINPTRIESLSGIIETLFYCLSAIVLAYNGVALYDDNNLLKSQHKQDGDEPDEEETAINKGSK